MNKSIWKLLLSAVLSACLLAGCSGDELRSAADSMAAGLEEKGFLNQKISFSYADKETGAAELISDEAYYDGLNSTELMLFTGDENFTNEDYRAFAGEQVLEMTAEDQAALNACIDMLQEDFDELGFSLPFGSNFSFIKTTMKERKDSIIYTAGSDICVSQDFIDMTESEDEYEKYMAEYLLSAELFRVIANNDPYFRENMYRILGFTIENEEPDFSEEVRSKLVKDSPSAKYDAHASFTLDGVPTEGTVVFYTEKKPKAGKSLYDICTAGVVPWDEPDRIVPAEKIPDFYVVMGRNLGEVISVDDCLSWNFGLATAFPVTENEELGDFPNPSIINEMHAFLANGTPTKSVTGKNTPEGEGEVTEDELEAVAMEVIRGYWGNANERIERLTAAGYDAKVVQKRVNEIMKTLR
ncbi:MAG: hypothetical protein K5985_01525 [Lachnospiraceae bacterium]|nr:hypothetical protein [Lachnospiraceae bacterium]